MTAPGVRLDPPGAGLPPLEAFVLRRLVVPVAGRLSGWDRSSRLFEDEARRILALAAPLEEARLNAPILVRRPLGIEDSSRFWSVAQTAEHLVIVGRSILDVVMALTHGRPAGGDVDIAAFKPAGRFAGQALEVFAAFAREYPRAIAGDPGDRRARGRHRHPWFGDMTARQWHWLAATHQRLHRRQVERIVRGLPPAQAEG